MSSKISRLPSHPDAILLFGWCVFLIHVWAIFNILVILPSWALRLGLVELLGVAAYPLAFALLESFLVWALLVALSALLPRQLMRIDSVSQSATFISVLAVISVVLHFSPDLVFKFRLYALVTILLAIALGLYLSYLAGRSQKVSIFAQNFLSRVSLLSWIYIFLDLVAVAIIIVRNL